jgi:hypothetical protein
MEFVVLPIAVQQSLQTVISQFAFILTMFNKYEKVLSKAANAPNFDTARSLGWIVFILGRMNILGKRNEIVECACLLVSVMTIILSNLKGSKEESVRGNIRKMLCEVFRMKSQEPIIEMEGMVEKMIMQIEGRKINLCELLEPDRAKLLMKKMSSKYQQSLQLDEIDERIFIVSEVKITTPLKFTPFARQGVANKLITPSKPEDTDCAFKKLRGSKRTLNYEVHSKTKENVNFSTKFNEIKFEQYPTKSPYTVNKLPTATPITRAMEMNNWLQDHIFKCTITETGLTSYLSSLMSSSDSKALLQLLERLLSKLSVALGNESTQIKSNDIKAFYFRIMESVIGMEEKTLSKVDMMKMLGSNELHKAAIAAATEVVLFINNSMAIRFEQILELCEMDAFEFWKLIAIFLKFDPMMPSPLKSHFHQIETKILTFLAWQKNSTMHRLLGKIIEKERIEEKKNAIRIENSYCIEDSKVVPMNTGEINNNEPTGRFSASSLEIYLNTNTDITPAHEYFFKRVLHDVASKIVSLSEVLGVGESSTKEKIWELMKFCLSTETDLLIDRHMDQILLCATYAVSKMTDSKITFNTIISKYIETHSYASDFITSLFFHIKIDEKRYEDLIGFYNHVFISRARAGICACCKKTSTKPNPLHSAKQKIKALAPQSPLNENLPPAQLQHQIGNHARTFIGNLSGGKQINASFVAMTPRTKALYAFGDGAIHSMKSVLTPSAISESKENYKDNLKSQIMIPRKGLPPIRDPNLGKKLSNRLVKNGKPPKVGNRFIPHLGPMPSTVPGCTKNLFSGKGEGPRVPNDKRTEALIGDGA